VDKSEGGHYVLFVLSYPVYWVKTFWR